MILYQAEDKSISLEVRVEDETVWLTQAQMAELFQTTRNNITLHIKNIFKEKELLENSVCKDSLLTASDGKNYRTKYYNLDLIISVGYRVKSLRGTQFRIWANQVLKDHLLRGYSLSKRVDRIEDQVDNINHKLEKIDFQIQTNLPPDEGIFFNGQIFDAWIFATELVRSAKHSILLIDNYVDEQVLLLLSKREENVRARMLFKILLHRNERQSIHDRRSQSSNPAFKYVIHLAIPLPLSKRYLEPRTLNPPVLS